MAAKTQAEGSTHSSADPDAGRPTRRRDPGNAEAIGSGLSELRIHHGPGYRVYYRQQGDMLLILLCGGDKSTQPMDIEKAQEIAKEWENNATD